MSNAKARGKLAGVRLRDEERMILEKFKQQYGLSYTDTVRFAIRKLDEEESMIKKFLTDLRNESKREVSS